MSSGGVYGASADGVHTVKQYLRAQTDLAVSLSNQPETPLSQAELIERINRLDRAHQNITFANGVVEYVLRNINQLQP